MSVEAVKQKYPLHYAIWTNNLTELQKLLSEVTESNRKEILEKQDPWKRTPLALAVTLNHLDCVKKLLEFNADATIKSKLGFALVKEAVTTANSQLLQEILIAKKKQTAYKLRTRVPELLRLLGTTGDFYVEMHWEFSSWVPLLSRVCPSDTYKIWKRGASVRIDTTLVGFEDMKWIRGNLSFIFKATGEPGSMNGILYQINHDSQSVIFDEIHSGTSESLDELGMEIESNVTDDVVDSLLSAPVSSTELASEKISFTRLKSGVWGFQSDKTETVNSYEAKVYSVNKVELITRQRTEHLPIELREQVKQKGGTFASIMKFATSQAEGNDGSDDEGDAESGRATSLTPVPPVLSPRISAEEYFLGTPSEHTTGYSNNSESLEEDDSSDTEDVPHVSDNTKDKYSRLVHEGKGSAESEESSASSLLSFSSWKSGAKKLLNGVSNVTSSAFSSSSSSSANNYSSNLGNSSNETDSNNSSGAFKTISSAPESVSSSDAKSPAYAIGRPLVMTEQVQKFKATAWMSDDFPLSLQQQVIPIINLMSTNNAHFAKLQDFIELRLPSGFPVKIEIPLYRVVSAQISFLNCSKGPVDESLFEVPRHYSSRLADGFSGTVEVTLPSSISGAAASRRSGRRRGGRGRREFDDAMLDDDVMMQIALQESLRTSGGGAGGAGGAGAGGANNLAPTSFASSEDYDLQRAILASMMQSSGSSQADIDAALNSLESDRQQQQQAQQSQQQPQQQQRQQQQQPEQVLSPSSTLDADLAYALRISNQDMSEERERERREQEELEMVLKLSMEQQ